MESRATNNPPSAPGQGPEISRTIRAVDWWEFKLSPLFGAVYATAFSLNLSVSSLWPLLLMALVALVPGAAYVSVINDLTDLEEDQASGKTNRLVGKSRAYVGLVLACCILPGIAVSVYWRADPLLLSLYLAAWTAFTLYSVPPVRLKKRGVFGFLADASGAHLFPTLLAVGLVYRWWGGALDPAWFAAVAAWALCFGLRGILWHQISDLHNDEKIGLRTFARRHKIARLRGLGNFIIFPVEAAAFGVLLWLAGSRLALALLGFYALLEWARSATWRTNLVIVLPKERYRIAMHEYYEVFFPLAFLLSSSARYPQDALLIVAHLLFFPRRATQTLKDVLKLLRQRAYLLLR